MAMMSSFPPARFSRAFRVNPSPHFCAPPAEGSAQDSEDSTGGFMIASGSTRLQWHVIDKVRDCLYGEVLRAVEVGHGGHFAIKQMSVERIYSEDARNSSEDPLKEVSVLQFLEAHGPHPNIIEVIEVLRDDDYIYVVLPFCNGGELFSVVSATRGLSEDAARPIFRGLLAGMAFLHSLHICHRDMSLENVLVTGDGQAKIIDFGMALMVGQPQGRRGGRGAGVGGAFGGGDGAGAGAGGSDARSISPTGPFGKKNYMPPEVALNEQEYDGYMVDVWACGVVMFITLAGIPPFHIPIPAEDQRCQVIAVERRLEELVRRWNLPLSPEVVSLIQACLLINPNDRSSVQELLGHPWLL